MKLWTALLTAGLVAVAAGQEPAIRGRIAAEIDRAREGLIAAAPEAERAGPIARLDRAKTALDAGRLYLAAYLLESPWEGAKNFTFIKPFPEGTTQEAFLKKWTEVGEPKRVASRAPRVPAVVEAIAAAAEGRGPTTYQASRMYGEDSGVGGGLYYLADSHSVMQFAGLVRGLDWPAIAARPPFRSIAGEIGAFDIEMTTAYETMERAQHPTYIGASAALKQARTLNERGQHAGALFEYLLSRYLFAPLRGPAAGEATAARIAAARASLAGADHSIAEMFLQLADEALAGGSDAQKRNAATVLEDILPAYRAALGPPVTTTAAAANSQVTITLVRWPYT